jgi:hypothetical protein
VGAPKDFKAWVRTLDLSTPEGRARAATETAQKVLEEVITPSQSNSVAALIRAAEGKPGNAPAKPEPPLGVRLRYGRQQGQQPAELRLLPDQADGDEPA